MIDPQQTPLPATIFRKLFQHRRIRGHMRLGTWMSRFFPSMRDVVVPHHDGVLHLDLAEMDHQKIFLDGGVQFEDREVELVKALVKPGDVVMDVGAHLGVYATLLAQLVGDSGLVLAYEPQPRMLHRNAAAYPQLIVRPFAVSQHEGTASFQAERSSGLSHIEPAANHLPQTRTVTLDQEVERLRLKQVAFLKIDVEGHEQFVLQGARQLLTSQQPPILLFEWVPYFANRWTTGAIQTLRTILGAGWVGFQLGFDGTTAPWNDWSEAKENTNYLLVPPHRAAMVQGIKMLLSIK